MITKYLRELSIVVLGVAITISAGSYLGRKSDQAKLSQYLNAVKLELEQNGRVVDQFQQYYTQLRAYGQYLRSAEDGKYSPDSLSKYRLVVNTSSFFIYKSGAFQLLQSSGYMSLIDNDELLTSLWDCYSTMEIARLDNDYYLKMQTNEIFNTLKRLKSPKLDYNKSETKELLLFFMTGLESGIKETFDSCQSLIKATKGQL